MKNILVIGAHGGTGSEVVKALNKSDSFTPIAAVRSMDQVKAFENEGIEARYLDLQESVSQIASAMDNIDAVVFAAGGGWMVDLDGKVKAAQAAEKRNIKRFMLISAGGIQHFHDDNHLPWMDEWKEYSAAMYYGDMYILNSNLDFTIIRPENLTNESGIGKVTLGQNLPHKYSSRANVAATVVASLENDNTIKKAFDMMDGDTPVNEAVENI